MAPCPADEATLRAELACTPALAKAWTLFACEEALAVWERNAAALKMKYRDGTVGLEHEIDRALPRRTLLALVGDGADHAALAHEWLEPITALQDDDWSLPKPALYAFYACYNALEGNLVTAILQARDATELELEDAPDCFEAIWERWWQRCLAAATAPQR